MARQHPVSWCNTTELSRLSGDYSRKPRRTAVRSAIRGKTYRNSWTDLPCSLCIDINCSEKHETSCTPHQTELFEKCMFLGADLIFNHFWINVFVLAQFRIQKSMCV